jgi:AraC-like DNA-binding protein
MPTPFRFSEHRPDARLHRWILTYWEFEVGEGAPATHHVPPDGCTSLLHASRDGVGMLLTSGPWTTPLVVPATPGQLTRGIRLAPGAAPALLDLPADQLVNRVTRLSGSTLLPLDRIMEALRLPNLPDAVQALDALLIDSQPRWPETDHRVARAIGLLWHSGGTMPLPAVAAQTGCSPRTLLRIVRKATGLTPKQFARIVRFHSAARVMANGSATLSQAAAEGGYADQPHFHHEVAALTGLTPAQLAERVRRTDHRQG